MKPERELVEVGGPMRMTDRALVRANTQRLSSDTLRTRGSNSAGDPSECAAR